MSKCLILKISMLYTKSGGGSSMIRFPLVIAVSERDMPGIEPGPLGWHTSALTNKLQEVRLKIILWMSGVLV